MGYVRGWKKQPDGTYKKVWVDEAKAKRIRGKVSGAASKAKRGPGVYAGIKGDGWAVDGNNVRAAVKSVVDSQVAPLNDLALRQGEQTNANINASSKLKGALTNQIGQLQAQNSLLNTGVLGAASRAAAQDQAGLGSAAGFLSRTFGPAYNAQTAAQLGDAAGVLSTQGNTGAVQNAWGAGLTGQMQNDFMTRAQQVAATTHLAFTAEQRARQAEARRSLQRQIAAIRGSGGALQRQFLREDAQFGLERKTAEDAMRIAAEQQAFQAQQAALDRQAQLANTALSAGARGSSASAEQDARAQQAAREETNTAVGTLTKALADATTLSRQVRDGELAPGAAAEPLEAFGLVAGRDFVAVGGTGVALTHAGLKRFFVNLTGLSPYSALAAIKRVDPAKAKDFRVVTQNGAPVLKWDSYERSWTDSGSDSAWTVYG